MHRRSRVRNWNLILPLMMVLFTLIAFQGLLVLADGLSVQKSARFTSKIITSTTPGHRTSVDVDITDAKKLILVVTDGGNGYGCDWADWAEPRLVGPNGELRLTELKWQMARADWGKVRINRNAGGGPLRIAGQPVEYGIGTHANSVIIYDLPKGYTRFKAVAGLDNGGSDQQGGAASSVQFHVYLDEIPNDVRRLVLAAGKRGGRSGGKSAEESLAALDVGDGMEATIFASEPMMLNPTNIDIDAKGRVWVCEVVNYRGRNGTRREGDRILILEDTDGDGMADRHKVYYQGRDVDSAMGICVLGNKVIVSCSPNVWIFTDENGDDIPDKKEVLFTKTGDAQHDHSAHAFVFGPDGRLYWNFGNTGHAVHDKLGKPIIDLAGNQVAEHSKPYRQGMVFRCNLDGSDFEVLGWNFRNNYEVAVDSFGTLWQSDNDDDGNRGVRINYVMEFGNYGYVDEITNASWRTPRTGWEEDIPSRHWHQNDPGVVPNLLQTGAGSPTGICINEGTLLPPRFRNQVIHADAGPNVVRAYPVKNAGAGYRATIENILVGTRDQWYRPADVCIAPDGSLFIADWYDPGVGGHAMGDIDRGRIFRVAKPNMGYKIPTYDYSTAEGAVKALANPALSVRYLAWTALHSMQEKAEPALRKVFEESPDARYRARALWLLGRIKGRAGHYIQRAAADKDADIRIVALRLARQQKLDVIDTVKSLVRDPSPQVRRECAIALRNNTSAEAPKLWAVLAGQYDGKDRWYLEALGIGAEGQWDAFLSAWLKEAGDRWNSAAGREIIWRSRATSTPEYLGKVIADPTVSREALPRYLRAFDFQHGPQKNEVLIQLAFAPSKGDDARQTYIVGEALSRLKNLDLANNPQYKAAINRVLDQLQGSQRFVKLVEQFQLRERFPDLMRLAQQAPSSQIGVDAIAVLLANRQHDLIRRELGQKDVQTAMATAQVLAAAKDGRAYSVLLPLLEDKDLDLQVRREAVRAMAGFRRGAEELLARARAKRLDPLLSEAVAATLHHAPWREVKAEVAKLFPLPAAKDNRPLPNIGSLLSMRGDRQRGMKVFQTTGTCAACHIVHKTGKEVGPDLSEIGDKLTREALFESILFPSAGISHNYESYAVVLKSGNVETGVLVSQTPDEVSIKAADALVRTFKRADVDEVVKQPVSLMPADLAKLMSEQDLVDVVEYLTSLKKSNGIGEHQPEQRPSAKRNQSATLLPMHEASDVVSFWKPGLLNVGSCDVLDRRYRAVHN